MGLAQRTDAALLELARQGSAPAFATILHRHAADVHRSVASTSDPLSAVRATFLDAMRRLGSLDGDLGAALRDLAVAHGGVRDPTTSAHGELSEAQIDDIWAAIAPRWPSGRARSRMPRAVPRVALVALLIGVGFVVPRLVLTSGDTSPGEELEHLVAQPYEEADEDPTDDDADDEDPEIPLLPIPDADGPNPLEDGQGAATTGDTETDASDGQTTEGDAPATGGDTTAPGSDGQAPEAGAGDTDAPTPGTEVPDSSQADDGTDPDPVTTGGDGSPTPSEPVDGVPGGADAGDDGADGADDGTADGTGAAPADGTGDGTGDGAGDAVDADAEVVGGATSAGGAATRRSIS